MNNVRENGTGEPAAVAGRSFLRALTAALSFGLVLLLKRPWVPSGL